MLVQSCRQLKETLLGADAPERLTLNLPWSGSRLIGGARQIEVDAARSRGPPGRWLLSARAAGCQTGPARLGLSGVRAALRGRPGGHALSGGLPVGPSPRGHGRRGRDAAHDPARPDIVLFNGGLFLSPALRQRLLGRAAKLVRAASPAAWQPLVLDNERLDLAVARGAAYYGMVRRGQGVRIAAGLARTYYIGVETLRRRSPTPPERPKPRPLLSCRPASNRGTTST